MIYGEHESKGAASQEAADTQGTPGQSKDDKGKPRQSCAGMWRFELPLPKGQETRFLIRIPEL